jgi:hypothetical protein
MQALNSKFNIHMGMLFHERVSTNFIKCVVYMNDEPIYYLFWCNW